MVTTKEDVMKRLQEKMPFLKSEFGVKRIGLFGSFGQGTQHDQSDVDLITEFERPIGLRFIEFANFIEEILGRKADILTIAGIAGIRNKEIADHIMESIVYV